MPGLPYEPSLLSEIPPFDDTVKTHPLLVIDYAKIKAHDEAEIDELWKACTSLGFFYLKNHGCDPEPMFNMGAETFALPLEEKLKFEQGDGGMSFGYKAAGFTCTDEFGNPDRVEFINISKDDCFAYPKTIHRTYPAPTTKAMESTGPAKNFIGNADAVLRTLLEALEKRLGLAEGTILGRHDGYSPSEARTIKMPPVQMTSAEAAKAAALGSHTDFGTFSFLFNRMVGGLQVLVPGSKSADDWQYIRPLEGHAVCNLGDCASIYSGGILKSNIHRVVSPPGPQANTTRWSQVYFIRPAFDAQLEILSNESEIIREAANKWDFKLTPCSSGEWFARRVKGQRAKNRTGPETWRGSRGTEHKPDVA